MDSYNDYESVAALIAAEKLQISCVSPVRLWNLGKCTNKN